jgi:hypothetical protein
MSRRGCSLPANASGLGPHRASLTSRFGQVDFLAGRSGYSKDVARPQKYR